LGAIHYTSAPLNFNYTVIFFWAKLVRNGRIRAVEVRPQKFRANFSQFGRISSIAQPKNLLIWRNFAHIERNSPEIFGAKLNCAGSPISGEKNNYCVLSFLLLYSLKTTKIYSKTVKFYHREGSLPWAWEYQSNV
jgi:hypothetical protein